MLVIVMFTCIVKPVVSTVKPQNDNSDNALTITSTTLENNHLQTLSEETQGTIGVRCRVLKGRRRTQVAHPAGGPPMKRP
jgi:acyl-coenzyme A thioesterase PaaI-like protein